MVNFDYLFNKEYYGESLNKNYHIKKSLGFQFLKDATVFPDKGFDVWLQGNQGGGY